MIFQAVLASMLLLLDTTASPSASPPGCSNELVMFSPCLGFVSATPNNITDTATSQCCDAFSNALNSSDGNCFCYLINQPLIFGFPLNKSRLIALPSVCSLSSPGSFESLCSGPPVEPPLQGTTTSVPPVSEPAFDGSPADPLPPPTPALLYSSAEKFKRNGFLPRIKTSNVIFNHLDVAISLLLLLLGWHLNF